MDRSSVVSHQSSVVADVSERELIDRIQKSLPPAPDWMLVGIGDDAAVVEPERNRVEVLSVDALVEGVHFERAFVPPDAIGYRSLAVNLSDLAAMGASPRAALLSLVLPSSLPLADFDGIIAGFTRLAAETRLHLAGGNITRSTGPLMIDVTVVGSVKRRQALTRAGAKPGDELYVSGFVGSAGAGLQMLQSVPCPPLTSVSSAVERYLYPKPRLRLGTLLARNRAATACVDLSDGLADGLRQIAASSGVGIAIDLDALPLEPAAATWFSERGDEAAVSALTAGDDYELLFAVRPRAARRIAGLAGPSGTTLTRIGVCTKDTRLVMSGRSGGQRVERELPAPGFHHFR